MDRVTETQNPSSRHLDRMSVGEIVQLMNVEDLQVANAVKTALPQITKAIEAIVSQMKQAGHLFYVGAGTSGRLGILDAVECIPTFGTLPEQIQAVIAGGEQAILNAVEGAEDKRQQARLDLEQRNFCSQDILVGIAASGTTPYVLEAIKFAQEQGAITIGIACNQKCPLLEQSDHSIFLPVGPEVLTGSTRLKAGTAQKMVLNMISTTTMILLGKVYDNLMVDVQVTNHKLHKRAIQIIAQVANVSQESAQHWLTLAENNAKLAILMAKSQLSLQEAKQQLKDVDGMLDQALKLI